MNINKKLLTKDIVDAYTWRSHSYKNHYDLYILEPYDYILKFKIVTIFPNINKL